jgi:hypothetical protein
MTHPTIYQQNQYLRDLSNNIHTQYTDKAHLQHTKISYQFEQISVLNQYNYYLFYGYIITSIFLIAFLFVGSKANDTSIGVKIGIIIVVLIFPFIITPFEIVVYNIYQYFLAMLLGNAYVRPDY